MSDNNNITALAAYRAELEWIDAHLFQRPDTTKTREFITNRTTIEARRLLRLCELIDAEAALDAIRKAAEAEQGAYTELVKARAQGVPLANYRTRWDLAQNQLSRIAYAETHPAKAGDVPLAGEEVGKEGTDAGKSMESL